MKMKEFKNFIGVDISKSTLDLALITEDNELIELKLKNDESIILKTLKQVFKDHNLPATGTLICAEDTGRFGNKLINTALRLQLNIWIESAFNILHSQGLKRGKNDQVDALRIAEYAKRFSDKCLLYTPQAKSVELLERLDSERDLVVKDIAKYKSQLKQEDGFFDSKYFKEKERRLQKIIKFNEKILRELDERITEIIKEDESLNNNYQNIITIEGVGPKTAVATIIATGNFTRFTNPRKFACHAGCAPFRYDSGTSIRSRNRVSHRANKNLKRIYHMAALSTLTMKGELRQYYDRKVEEGKNKMSVINALRSKLIHRVFAVVKQNRKYDKNYTHSLG